MHLAFSLFRYFPYGGLQRDFRKLAEAALSRGHEVTILTMKWQGPRIKGARLLTMNPRSWSRYERYRRYADWAGEQTGALAPDCLVGFNKIPGLDIYYAADSCLRETAGTRKSWFYRLLPRFRHFARFEAAVFAAPDTRILLLTEQQQSAFRRHYAADERMTVLPPGISPDCIAPEDYAARRKLKRQELGIGEAEILLLAIGSDFARKGLSRTLQALSSLPEESRKLCQLRVLGQGKPGRFKRRAKRLGLADQVVFLGGQDDVPDWLLAGDLLLHPAREEVAGMVLLEAVVAGCPVLASDICGYAPLVIQAGAGEVISSPFSAEAFSRQLAKLIVDAPRRRAMSARGRARGMEADWFSMADVALLAIEDCARAKQAKSDA